MNPASSISEVPTRAPSPLVGGGVAPTPPPHAGEAAVHTRSPLAREAAVHTPSPLAGEGWDGGGPTQRWHVIRSKPRAESIARFNLERQGFRVYCPQLLKPARVKGRWRDRIEPLFPRYLFLALDACGQSLAPVRSTLGVSDVVRFGMEYATVADHIVDGLKRREDPQSGLHRLEQPPFRRGGRIRILEGPLERLEGVFERHDGEERAFILLEVLGRTTRVRVLLDSLIPLPIN